MRNQENVTNSHKENNQLATYHFYPKVREKYLRAVIIIVLHDTLVKINCICAAKVRTGKSNLKQTDFSLLCRDRNYKKKK